MRSTASEGSALAAFARHVVVVNTVPGERLLLCELGAFAAPMDMSPWWQPDSELQGGEALETESGSTPVLVCSRVCTHPLLGHGANFFHVAAARL